MAKPENPLVSVVVPLYNEQAGLAGFHEALVKVVERVSGADYELIYCDDGSRDDTAKLVRGFHAHTPKVKLLSLTRNFGKEIATTAGVHEATGQAIVTLDADGQHPVELIPQFVERWQGGSKVVIGLRVANQQEGWVKRLGSKLFYGLFSRVTGIKLVAGATDFRLIDSSVQREFARMTEHNRITRGLIDWLGHKQDYIEFTANPRLNGQAGYSFRKLVKLAIDSAVSLSVSPLYLAAYLGVVVVPLSVIIALVMLIDAVVGDPLKLHATGSAYVVVLLLFLVGVLLLAQGIIGLYLSHIHTEAQNRPLYIIDQEKSIGVTES